MFVSSPLAHSKTIVSGVVVASALALATSFMAVTYTANAQDGNLSAGQEIVVNTDALNLRSDSSSTSDVITVLPQAAFATILDGPIAGDDYTWYQITIDDTSGYVAADYIADATSAGVFSIGDTVYVNTEALNLRDSATISGSVMDVLATGATGTVVDGPVEADGYAWYQIDVDGVTGWAVRDYLAYGVSAGATNQDIGSNLITGQITYVNTDALNVREVAGLDGSVIEKIYSNEAVTLTGTYQSVDGYDWALVQTASGNTGYVVSDYLTTDPAALLLSVGTVAYVNTDGLNLRDLASMSGSIIAELTTGQEVTILSASVVGDGYLWLQVVTSSGTGWVVGEYLAV